MLFRFSFSLFFLSSFHFSVPESHSNRQFRGFLFFSSDVVGSALPLRAAGLRMLHAYLGHPVGRLGLQGPQGPRGGGGGGVGGGGWGEGWFHFLRTVHVIQVGIHAPRSLVGIPTVDT